MPELIEPTEQAPSRAVRPAVTELTVTGMTCGNCARHVTEALQSTPGVQTALVNLEAGRATVRWSLGASPDFPALVKAVEEEGFGARVLETAPQADAGKHRLAGWRLNLWLGLPITALLMLGEWGVGLGAAPWYRWASFGLAFLVQVLAGARFYRGAWNQLKQGRSNMDTLVALGSTTAFAYSTWLLFSVAGGHLYFMEAAAIITLISTGHWLESRVSVRASDALRKLLNLAPALARRLGPNGQEIQTQVADLQAGDVVVLRPGDRVPSDGEVVEGGSAVDESMLTGESAPVDKAPSSPLYAGTVNLNGRLVMRVTAIGEETALAHIIAAVQRAQNSRAEIQRLGDRVSSVFVPIVVTIALAAGLWWGLAPGAAGQVHAALAHLLGFSHLSASVPTGFIVAAAVLIIACPCAMGLATPAAIMAGSNAAAQRGILIRDGIALEKAGRVNVVVFDKTGTLTIGRPSLVNVWLRPTAAGEAERNRVLGLATTLARPSSHPISQALVTASAPVGQALEWLEIHGAGVQARVQAPVPMVTNASASSLMRLGSLRWLRVSGVDLAPGTEFVEQWASQGATLVGLAAESTLLALFAMRDTVKTGAQAVVAQLHGQGFKTYLLTGDNARTAASIAQHAGIESANVFADVRPEQKAEFIKKLQGQGERVAFVGDGINDAPALEQADLGIAVGRASDIAREAADIILLNSELQAVPESLGLARATLRTIKQNLFWAFFYNAAGLPLAALGFMSPILCAAAMALSDLVVIGNALRLRRWRL